MYTEMLGINSKHSYISSVYIATHTPECDMQSAWSVCKLNSGVIDSFRSVCGGGEGDGWKVMI